MTSYATEVRELELRADVSPEARNLIESWLQSLTLVASYYPAPDTVITVAKGTEASYHVTAFFRLGPRWVHSADAQGVSADEAFRALTMRLNPSVF